MNRNNKDRRKAVVLVAVSILFFAGVVLVAIAEHSETKSSQEAPSWTNHKQQAHESELVDMPDRSRRVLHGSPRKPLTEIIANRFDLHFFEAAIVSTGWSKVLEGNIPHTFFAPCDDFFYGDDQKILKAKLMKPEYKTHLYSLVGAQLVDGNLSPRAWTPRADDTVVDMMDHECKTKCAKSSTGAMRINGYNRVLDSEEGSNGYAYVTQRAVEPPFWYRTVWDVIQFDLDDQVNSFAKLIGREGLVEDLMDPDADYTVFVPTNEAMLSRINANDFSPYGSWEELARTHIVPSVQATRYLEDKVTLLTDFEGNELDLEKAPRGPVKVWFANKNVETSALVIEKDILACNGVVHVVDAVL